MKNLTVGLFFYLICIQGAGAASGDQYLLPKLGFMDIQINDPSPLWSAGLLYGFGLTNRFSVEGEVNLGISGGDYEKRDSATGAVIEKGSYQVSTLAAYGTYRLPLWKDVYAKAKMGVLYEQVRRELEQTGSREDSDFGLAGGVGFGARMFNKITLELEATVIDKDIIFYSLGTHVSF